MPTPPKKYRQKRTIKPQPTNIREQAFFKDGFCIYYNVVNKLTGCLLFFHAAQYLTFIFLEDTNKSS